MKIIFLLITFSFSFLSIAQQVDDFRIRISSDSVFKSQTITEPYLVLFFLAKDCPFDQVYKERITEIHDHFPQHKLYTVGDLEIKNIQNFSKKNTLQFEFKIKKTPTVIIAKNLQNGFRVFYKGPIDNNPQLPKITTTNSLFSILKNPTPQKNNFYTPGCLIH